MDEATTQYEYKLHYFGRYSMDGAVLNELNLFGREGWRVVDMDRSNPAHGLKALLMREVRSG